MATIKSTPPFTEPTALPTLPRQRLPPTFRQSDQLLETKTHMSDFLQTDLLTPRLNQVHRHLWLAGLCRPARPLHRQKLLGRTIFVTERPDEHLVWHEQCIFIKPLPEYLLDYQFWEKELCRDEGLYSSACGLVMSYAWLVSSKNDLRIAHEMGLLPEEVRHEDWTASITDFLSRFRVETPDQIDKRYDYGELRLSRLNTLYRCGFGGFSLRNIVNGFMPGSSRYTTFFQRNFGWILVVLVYITVVLSILQVALATDRLGQDAIFQRFSFSVVMLGMSFVLVAVSTILLVWFALFSFHLLSTLSYQRQMTARKRQRKATAQGQNQA